MVCTAFTTKYNNQGSLGNKALLSEIAPSVRVPSPIDSTRTARRVTYAYDADSDLEECEIEHPITNANVPATEATSSKQAPNALARESTLSFVVSLCSLLTVATDTSKTSVLNLSDSDVTSLDGFGSETGLSEILQNPTIGGPSSEARVSPKPSLSVETTEAVLTWRNEQDSEHKDATPRDVCITFHDYTRRSS